MNVLVLIPRLRRIECAVFGSAGREPLMESHAAPLPTETEALMDLLRRLRADCTLNQGGPPDLVVIRAVYGGSLFPRTAKVDAAMLARFATLAAEAPMHVPPALLLARAALRTFARATVVMAFETGFFVDLPKREQRYAVSDAELRRFGYHGFFHEAAALESEGRSGGRAKRTLSLCLESRPELAAILGGLGLEVDVDAALTPLGMKQVLDQVATTSAARLGWK